MSNEHYGHGERARRRFLTLIGAGVGLGLGAVATTTATAIDEGDETGHPDEESDDENSSVEDDPGLITLSSADDFSTTVDRVEAELEARDLVLVTTVDHAENAETIGESLEPTTLFMFGNPEAGTPLIQNSRSIGIDLPQKLLVWEDDGEVFVTYNDVEFLSRRHGLEGVDDQLAAITDALDDLANAVAQGNSS